jgi:hypothetical protein
VGLLNDPPSSRTFGSLIIGEFTAVESLPSGQVLALDGKQGLFAFYSLYFGPNFDTRVVATSPHPWVAHRGPAGPVDYVATLEGSAQSAELAIQGYELVAHVGQQMLWKVGPQP